MFQLNLKLTTMGSWNGFKCYQIVTGGAQMVPNGPKVFKMDLDGPNNKHLLHYPCHTFYTFQTVKPGLNLQLVVAWLEASPGFYWWQIWRVPSLRSRGNSPLWFMAHDGGGQRCDSSDGSDGHYTPQPPHQPYNCSHSIVVSSAHSYLHSILGDSH